MAKLFAFGAYFYQALLAFGLLMIVARLLAPADYVAYSLFIGTTQLGAYIAFEWLRYACSRFYPGLDADMEKTQRRTLLIEALASAGFCLVAGAAGMLVGIPPGLTVIGGAVAAAQGGSDLHLSVVRFGQRFSAFSTLNAVRASLLAVCTIAGALFGRNVLGATGGLLAGYLLYAAFAAFVERGAYASGGRWSSTAMRDHVRYGGVSAGMSVLSLLSPLGLKLILTTSLGAAPAAGVLLALDLLQRPFIMMVAALQTVEYPDVVAAYDRRDPALPRRLGQFYAMLATLSLVSAAGLFVVLRPVAEIIVRPELRDAFLLTGPLVIVFSMLRTLTQNMSTTPAHLKLSLRELTLLALADCISFNALGFAASLVWPDNAVAIVAGAMLGAVITALYGLIIMRTLPFALPWAPVAIGTLAAFVAAGLFFALGGNIVVVPLLAGLAVGAIALAALLAMLATMRGGCSPAPAA